MICFECIYERDAHTAWGIAVELLFKALAEEKECERIVWPWVTPDSPVGMTNKKQWKY
jgi:hypothetical protein